MEKPLLSAGSDNRIEGATRGATADAEPEPAEKTAAELAMESFNTGLVDSPLIMEPEELPVRDEMEY